MDKGFIYTDKLICENELISKKLDSRAKINDILNSIPARPLLASPNVAGFLTFTLGKFFLQNQFKLYTKRRCYAV